MLYQNPDIFIEKNLLNSSQIKSIAQFNNLDLSWQDYSCICKKNSNSSDKLICKKDRYGINISIYICNNCGMIRPIPYYDPKTLSNFYKNFYWGIYDANDPESIFPGQLLRGEKYSKLLKDLSIKGESILEIGCGAGGILIPFTDSWKKCVGYDYDQNYLDFGNKKNSNIQLKFGGLDDAVENELNKFDVVILSHVFEHIPDLDVFLDKIRKLLKSNGKIVVAVPSNKSIFKRSEYEYDFRWYLVNAHAWYFSQEHLSYVFKKNGFNQLFLSDGEPLESAKNAAAFEIEDITAIFQKNNKDHLEIANISAPILSKRHKRMIMISKFLQFFYVLRILNSIFLKLRLKLRN
jgi:2-polyprenyl-3-methyl-5-hydroxy-6-metoxy-1,4-benzoquinol methylase